MASDANLIKGAAAAAGGAAKIAGATSGLNMAYSQAMQGAAANLEEKKARLTAAKKRDQEFSDTFAANSEAADLQAGALGEAEYDITQKRIAGLKKQYDRLKLGDDSGRQKILGQLARESQGLTSQKDARVLNAKALKTLRTDVSSEDRHVMGAFANSNSGAYTIDEDASGELTYTFTMPEGSKDSEGNPITEKKMSSAEVQKLYEMQTDAVGAKATKDKALVNITAGEKGEEFDEANNAAAFDDLVTTDASFMSALHDDWGVGSFSASIDDKISNELQSLSSAAQELDLGGISMPLDEGEANWYDNISMKDAGEIKRRLMNPSTPEEKEISKTVLREYYVDAQRQQHARGVKKAEDATNAAKQKRANELADKAREQSYKTELANLKGSIASEKSILDAKLKAGITNEETSVVDKLTIPNVNWKEGDDLEMKNINADPNVAITIGENLDNKNFIGGFQGQQDNSYYYKGSNNKFYKYNSYSDFAESNKIDIDTSNVDERGYPIISEKDQQKINDFNANKSGNLSGGQQVNRDQIYNDEGVGSATETVTKKSGNVEVDKIMNKRNAEKEKADQEAKDQEILSWINNPDNANHPNLEAVKKQYYLNRP